MFVSEQKKVALRQLGNLGNQKKLLTILANMYNSILTQRSVINGVDNIENIGVQDKA